MRMLLIMAAALATLATGAASAEGSHRRDREPTPFDDAWAGFWGKDRRGQGPVSQDTPWGPKYQEAEQVQRSMYDFQQGRKANLKEYWWRY